ncbi:MAG: hypothetical protein PHF00_13995, partial [Elusimicrobia bacterium]|nr:hypothetical protein [Elusimicrobiota bacterium]
MIKTDYCTAIGERARLCRVSLAETAERLRRYCGAAAESLAACLGRRRGREPSRPEAAPRAPAPPVVQAIAVAPGRQGAIAYSPALGWQTRELAQGDLSACVDRLEAAGLAVEEARIRQRAAGDYGFSIVFKEGGGPAEAPAPGPLTIRPYVSGRVFPSQDAAQTALRRCAAAFADAGLVVVNAATAARGPGWSFALEHSVDVLRAPGAPAAALRLFRHRCQGAYASTAECRALLPLFQEALRRARLAVVHAYVLDEGPGNCRPVVDYISRYEPGRDEPAAQVRTYRAEQSYPLASSAQAERDARLAAFAGAGARAVDSHVFEEPSGHYSFSIDYLMPMQALNAGLGEALVFERLAGEEPSAFETTARAELAEEVRRLGE